MHSQRGPARSGACARNWTLCARLTATSNSRVIIENTPSIALVSRFSTTCRPTSAAGLPPYAASGCGSSASTAGPTDAGCAQGRSGISRFDRSGVLHTRVTLLAFGQLHSVSQQTLARSIQACKKSWSRPPEKHRQTVNVALRRRAKPSTTSGRGEAPLAFRLGWKS